MLVVPGEKKHLNLDDLEHLNLVTLYKKKKYIYIKGALVLLQ